MFAVSFIVFRVLLWPYVSYYFWIDLLALLRDEQAHSLSVYYLFLGANVFLTSLQVLWLGENITTAMKLFSSPKDGEKTLAKNKSE